MMIVLSAIVGSIIGVSIATFTLGTWLIVERRAKQGWRRIAEDLLCEVHELSMKDIRREP